MLSLLRLAAFTASVPVSSATFSCKNEAGSVVDYFAALTGNSGTDVYYHDTASKGHLTQASSLDSDSSAIVRTVKQLYGSLGSSYAYAVYNDDTDTGKTNEARAHSKGVILFDGSRGFWLVHSLPRWPAAVASGYQGLPSTRYGQSYLCLTFSVSELEALAKIQLLQWPQIYSSGITDDLASKAPSFKTWIEGGRIMESQITATLRTQAGSTFTAYGKSHQCGCNLYNDVVAKGLGGDLYVESWQNGAASIKLPNFCKKDGYAHNIINVRKVQLTDGRNWKETQDHSKWAVTEKSAQTVCIGDMNRQSSQSKRGGGTVCYSNADLWQAFHEIVTDYDRDCDAIAADNTTLVVV